MSRTEASAIERKRDIEDLPLEFFDRSYEAFGSATRTVGCAEIYLRVGEFTVRLQFAGPALIARMSSAFCHLARSTGEHPDLTICIWDSASTGCKPARPQWREHYALRGEVEGYNTERFYTVYEHESCGMTLFDRLRDLAIVWVPEPSGIPYWVKGAPLRTIFYWWMGLHGQQLVHAAAIGNSHGGVLIAGKSGSGKSTTALSCLSAGMQYAGDDYVIAGLGTQPAISSLYNTAKLCKSHLHAFPHFTDLIDNPDRLDSEKALIFLKGPYGDRLVQGFPLRAILVPRVTGLRDTSLKLTSRAAALAALAPTTMFAHSRGGQHDFKNVASLVQKVPCYTLECGTDLAQIPEAITRLLLGGKMEEKAAGEPQ